MKSKIFFNNINYNINYRKACLYITIDMNKTDLTPVESRGGGGEARSNSIS